MLLSRGNLAVAKVASQNPLDMGINCIHVAKDGTTVGTNGKVMMAVGPVDENKIHFPEVGERYFPGEKGIGLPLDLVDKAVKNLPKDKRAALQHVAMTDHRDPRKVELTCTDMRHEQRVSGNPKEEPFPDWRATVRHVRGSGGMKVCVNRDDLIDVLEALREACPNQGGGNPVFLEIHQDGLGMAIRCANRETGQRAVGAINAYKTDGQWLPCDEWERGVFDVQVKLVRKVVVK